jgi:oligopeptide transport system ATP-binding protein
MSDNLLQVRNLRVSFFSYLGEVQAVRDVSFEVRPGEVLGIVGESGCGKTVTMLSVMQLLEESAKIKSGSIRFGDEELTAKSDREMRSIRGNTISMIFQDPFTSLNPVFTIGDQLTEAILSHKKMPSSEAWKRAVELLKLVQIPSAESRMKRYPYEMSGGMLQRVMIAIALAGNPALLIADEPTTALDVTIQAQILELMKDLQKRLGTAIVIITHDLGVVADFCDRIIVMYAGQIVEEGTKKEIFYNPIHPYTKGLLSSVPGPNVKKGETRLVTIPGAPPDLRNPPVGCAFAPRCRHAMRICARLNPELIEHNSRHKVRCWLYDPSNPNRVAQPLVTGEST